MTSSGWEDLPTASPKLEEDDLALEPPCDVCGKRGGFGNAWNIPTPDGVVPELICLGCANELIRAGAPYNTERLAAGGAA